jgi:uncharacterized protein (TIGR04255 family)
MKRGQFRFQIDAEKPAQAVVAGEEVDGWRYDSKDGSKVVQLRRSGMTFSVLKGYTKWGDFKASAQDVWLQYCKWAGNLTVGRLAVRYINVLRIPVGADIDNYLTAGPRIPPGVPQLLNGFFHRVTIPFADAEALAIVTQVLEPSEPVSSPVVLDIDVQSQKKYDGQSLELWSHLDKLRKAAHLIFFSSLTHNALELYR